MTLQASGAISFSDLQSEYSDTGSISMSELYRGGALVPTTAVTTGSYTSEQFDAGTTNRFGFFDNGTWAVWWANTAVYTGSFPGDPFVTGGYEYDRLSYQGVTGFGEDAWSLRRRTYSSSSANTNVPASGEIDLSNFYGGQG